MSTISMASILRLQLAEPAVFDAANGTIIIAQTLLEQAADEIERLHALVLDACKVFEHYDLPEHAFHYRRAILGLSEAKATARAAAGAT